MSLKGKKATQYNTCSRNLNPDPLQGVSLISQCDAGGSQPHHGGDNVGVPKESSQPTQQRASFVSPPLISDTIANPVSSHPLLSPLTSPNASPTPSSRRTHSCPPHFNIFYTKPSIDPRLKNSFVSHLSRPSLDSVTPPMPFFSYLRASPVIPNLSHILPLAGKTDFDSWDATVRGILTAMGLLEHVYDPALGFVVPSGFTVSGPPPDLENPTAHDTASSMTWWRNDQIAAHVLRNRLSLDITAPIASLGVASAKDLYAEIYHTFSARGWHAGKVQWDTVVHLHYDS